MKPSRPHLAHLIRLGGFAPLVFAILAAIATSVRADEHEPTHVSAENAGHGENAEHGGHGLDPKRLLYQFINFGLLVAILGFAGGKAINKTLAARHDQMKKDLDEASAARAAAQARLKEQEGRLANLESEVARLLAAIKDEAGKEEQRLLASAEEKARRIGDETQFLVAQQIKEAEQNFRQEVANATARIAEEIVRRSVKGEDETRLQQSFISDLESGAN
jgi:F-type H+-transporting ATPase subunit b